MSTLLTGKERGYWKWALPHAPFEAGFDEKPSSQVVQEIQRAVRALYGDEAGRGGEDLRTGLGRTTAASISAKEESLLWSNMAQLVRQLQEARKVMRRLMVAQGHGLHLAGQARASEALTQIAGQFNNSSSNIDFNFFEEEQQGLEKWKRSASYRMVQPPSPTVAPPSPIRKVKPAFCGKSVEATVHAMKEFPCNAKVQEKACRAIVDLIKDDKRERKHAHQKKTGWPCTSCNFVNEQQSETCSVCSRSRPNQVSERMAQEQAELDAIELTSQKLERLGGASIVVDAMRRFPSNEHVLKSAAFALAQLVHENAKTVQTIASAGGIRHILLAMQRLPQDAEFQTQCLGILASPALAEDTVVRVEGELFAQVACQAIRVNPRAGRLQALGCLALANLALKSDLYTKLLLEDPAYEAHLLVLDVLKSHTGPVDGTEAINKTPNPHVAAAGLWALGAFCRDLSDDSHIHIREAVTNAEAVKTAFALMSRFPTHQGVQNNAKLIVARLGFQVQDAAQQRADCVVS